MGAFFSMMSSSFQYDDPLSRSDLSTRKKTTEMFKEMGKGMYRSGRSFGKVGALYSGIECIIESVSSHGTFTVWLLGLTLLQYRAKDDMTNGIAGGFVTGGVLARASGPRGALMGAAGFAMFSGAIEMFLRRETREYVHFIPPYDTHLTLIQQ